MRLLEALPVDLGLEEKRGGALLAHIDVALGGNEESELESGAGAPRPDRGRYRLVSEAPLHEGRRNRVLRSGGVDRLTRGQLELVRRPLARDGKRPAHPALFVSHEKESLDLELVQDRLHSVETEASPLRNVLGRKRAPEPGKLGHREVPHAMVLLGHEREPRRARVLRVFQVAPEDVEGVGEDPVAPAHEDFIGRRCVHMYVPVYRRTCGREGFFEESKVPEVAMDAIEDCALRALVAVLRRAHAGELGASLAYQGHARSLADPTEAAEVLAIAREEMEHRGSVGRMLKDLGKRPRRLREALFRGVGSVVGSLCRVSGWLAPMYGAGRLESGNIREYEEAAGLAILAGRPHLAPELLRMAEVEWEHERYFRAKVLSRGVSLWPFLPLWSSPPPRETIGPRLPRGFRRRARSRGSRPLEANPRGPLRPASWRGTTR